LSNSSDPNYTVSLLLDYDGTLSPIAPTPEQAVLPAETKKVLERLAKR
jgi:trehalose-phosphatase